MIWTYNTDYIRSKRLGEVTPHTTHLPKKKVEKDALKKSHIASRVNCKVQNLNNLEQK